ncbi:MAG: TonB family protein [Bacteroidota bacterium]
MANLAASISAAVPYQSSGYGAAELKALYQRYMSFGLVFGGLTVFSVFGSYHLAVYLSTDDEPVHMVRITKYSELGPPPSIQSAEVAPSVAVAGPAVKPSIGIPVPVPDAEVNPEQTIATQTELSAQSAPSIEAGTGTGSVQVEQDIKIEDEPPPDFVAFEKEPVAVKSVLPKYPDIALRAGLEGNVYVKAWVDKEGKVRKVVVLKSDAQIFEQAAVDAASQMVFTPAIMQKNPVSVWVSIPFHFRLKNAK